MDNQALAVPVLELGYNVLYKRTLRYSPGLWAEWNSSTQPLISHIAEGIPIGDIFYDLYKAE